MKSLKRLISSVLIGIYIFTMNGNTFAINKNQNEIDSYNSTYLEEVSDFSTNQDESIYNNFEYSLNEVTPVINDVTKEKQFVFEDDIYTVVYEEQSEEFGTIYHVVKNNDSDIDTYTLWDVADIIMAGASWATFFKEPSFASFGLSVLDTVSCAPFIPSTAYVRKGGKTFIDSVKWSRYIVSNRSVKNQVLKKLICKEAGNPENISKVLLNYPRRKVIPSKVSYQLIMKKESMEHILVRHHPLFWNGTIKSGQSFFSRNMSVGSIDNIIIQVIDQNRAAISKTTSATGFRQYVGEWNKIKYKIGIDKGVVTQFYPMT